MTPMAAAGPPIDRPRSCQWEIPKICYPTRKRAERAVAALHKVGADRAGSLEVYRCRLHGFETPVWHVGHGVPR